MMKVLVALVVLGALALLVAVVPFHGRTVLDRWNAAPDAGAFFSRGWHEVRASLDSGPAPHAAHAPAHRSAPPSRAAARQPVRPAHPAAPVERHTDQDRAALDRLVAEHAGR